MPLKLFNFQLISVGGSHEPLKQVQLTATFLQSTKFMFRNMTEGQPSLRTPPHPWPNAHGPQKLASTQKTLVRLMPE